MLDIGWQELFIVAILAILVVGPKDLPRALKTVMHYVRKARGLAREFQSGVDEMVREADLDDLKQDLSKISDSKGLENTIKDAVDPTGELDKDLLDAQRDLDKTAKDAIKETEPDKQDSKSEPESEVVAATEQIKQAISESAPAPAAKTETIFTDETIKDEPVTEVADTSTEQPSDESGDDAKSPATSTNS